VFIFPVMGEEAEWAVPRSPPPSRTTTLVQNRLRHLLLYPGLTWHLTNPDIWGDLAIGALRVAPIKPAVSECEGLAPAMSVVKLLLDS